MAALAEICRSSLIDYQLALLVGSSTFFPLDLVGDLDVVFFQYGEFESSSSFSIAKLLSKNVQGTTYPISLAQALTADEELAFLYFREIRKLQSGVLIDG